MNPLDKYPAVRSALYLVQWLVTGIQTVLSAYFAFSIGVDGMADWPRWFLGSLAVAPVLWTYLGLTAQANTVTQPAEHWSDRVDDYSPADDSLEDYAARDAEVSGNDEGVINPEA
jgi:hypothetical protein